MSTFDIAFSSGFYGISFREHDPRLAWASCAVLNSAMASFQLLFGAGMIGLARPVIEPVDMMRIRVPRLDLDRGSVDEAVAALRARDDCRSLDRWAARAYRLNGSDRMLVRDSVGRGRAAFLDLKDAREEDGLPPSETMMRTYADAVCVNVNATLRFAGMRSMTASMALPRSQGEDPLASFAAARFRMVQGRKKEALVEAMSRVVADRLWDDVRHHLIRQDRAYLRETRSLRIYDKDCVTVVKPAQRRYWNAARGFQDADAIVADHWSSEGGIGRRSS